MKMRATLAVLLATATAAGIALPLFAADGPDSGPVARYDMRAGTTSGMGAGGRPNMAAMMMGGGGGSQVQHELWLRLGSDNAPSDNKPKADHFMPSGAKLGKSVALVTPKVDNTPTDELPSMERGRKPSGRILIYWGCGEHAPAGQPFVIDLAKLSTGQVPEGMWSSRILRDYGPSLANSKTFGRWPADDGKSARPDSSLIGAHRVSGNYSPDMNFALTKDFMPALKLSTKTIPQGPEQLSWLALPDATGYHASIFGGKQGPNGEMGDMVMWSSSELREFGGGLSDWLSPGEVAALVKDRTVLAPSVTSCIVPAEVLRDAPDFRMGTLTAFGPQEDFSYPPRPADAKARWDLEWTARIRHRSTTSWMEMQGMTMGLDDDNDSASSDLAGKQPAAECKPKKKKRGLGGLGGALGGALGGSLGRAAGNAAESAATTTEDCDD